MFSIAEAPPELLAALREIDADADLVCLGAGWWLLGVRAPNPIAQKLLDDEIRADPHAAARRREDRDALDVSAPAAATRFALLQLYASGFRPIQLYQTDRPGWEIVEDFRLRDFNYRNRKEEALDELRDAASIEAGDRRRTATLLEYVRQEAGFLWDHVFKGARRIWQRRSFPGA